MLGHPHLHLGDSHTLLAPYIYTHKHTHAHTHTRAHTRAHTTPTCTSIPDGVDAGDSLERQSDGFDDEIVDADSRLLLLLQRLPQRQDGIHRTIHHGVRVGDRGLAL